MIVTSGRTGVHLCDELRGLRRVGGAGEREVLLHEQALFAAEVVEGVVLVDAAALYPEHVHVGFSCGPEQLFVAPLLDGASEKPACCFTGSLIMPEERVQALVAPL